MSSTTEHTHQKSGFFAGFRTHPASVGESYFGHMRFALRFSGALFLAGGAALVHALMPPLCETTASRKVAELHKLTQHRNGGSD